MPVESVGCVSPRRDSRVTNMWRTCSAAVLVLVAACSTRHGGSDDASSANGSDAAVVPELTFAVLGDTRPAIPEDTGGYPTAIVTKIFQDIAAESPQPQFVI